MFSQKRRFGFKKAEFYSRAEMKRGEKSAIKESCNFLKRGLSLKRSTAPEIYGY